MIRDLLKENDWMAATDLKDAYLSVAIWEVHGKYLRFPWWGKVYKFQCLPFGLSTAPHVFTKLLKPVLIHLGHQRIRFIKYLDDILVMAQSRMELEKQLGQITSLLEMLGFVVNREKSQLHPAQRIQYLGFLIDPQGMKILLTGEGCRSMQENMPGRIPLYMEIGPANRETNSNTTSYISCPTVVPRVPVPQEPSTTAISLLRDIGHTD